jgi:hypothetical protein
MCKLSALIESYKTYLEVKYPSHFRNYCQRIKTHREGAHAEAVVFMPPSLNLGVCWKDNQKRRA